MRLRENIEKRLSDIDGLDPAVEELFLLLAGELDRSILDRIGLGRVGGQR